MVKPRFECSSPSALKCSQLSSSLPCVDHPWLSILPLLLVHLIYSREWSQVVQTLGQLLVVVLPQVLVALRLLGVFCSRLSSGTQTHPPALVTSGQFMGYGPTKNCDPSRDYTGISTLLTDQGASDILSFMNTF